MERRKFIKTGCGLCAGAMSLSVLGNLLQGCKPSGLIYRTESTNGLISIPVDQLSAKEYLVVRAPQLEYDILLVKESDTAFHALPMQCTHRQQPLVVTSTGLICNEHGSHFDLDGNVTRDPATRPLRKYQAELLANNILIHLS
jgi:nitrite reductase/ring-hydroxylating ferredoxin subunit